MHLFVKVKGDTINSMTKSVSLPFMTSSVQAGFSSAADEHIEGYLDLEPLVFADEQVFALKVKGDSMIEAGIMPQDLVLVHKQADCKNGDIVVALLEDRATVKFFKRCGNKVYLEPANKNYKPILVKGEFSLIGKVISVVRRYV